MPEVVIVGAGAAGISAARYLLQHRIDVQVLEAATGVGGRACTDHHFGFPIDLGAHWLHAPTHNPLRPYLDTLGIDYATSAYATQYWQDNRWLSPAEQTQCTHYIHQRFAALAETARATDCAVSDQRVAASPWQRAFTAEFINKQGANPHDVSALDFARYGWNGDDLPVHGGYGNLLSRLAPHAQIRCACAVRKITYTESNRLAIDSSLGTLSARAVIITVSTGVVNSGSLEFTPALPPDIRTAIAALPLSHCNKVILPLRPDAATLTTRDLRLVPITGTGDGIEILIRPGGHPVVIGLVGGALGLELADAGSRAMVDALHQHLRMIFGAEVAGDFAANPRTIDWSHDPHVLGYVATPKPGDAGARQTLSDPIDNRLFFAGEALSRDFMGDVHGAWLSGIEAATAAIVALKFRH